MATPQPPPPKPKKAAPSVASLNGPGNTSSTRLPPPPTVSAPVPQPQANSNHINNNNTAHGNQQNQNHTPPLPPRSPDITPNQASHHLNHLQHPQVPPRSPDTRSPELHSQQSAATHSPQIPPLPPRTHSINSLNNNNTHNLSNSSNHQHPNNSPNQHQQNHAQGGPVKPPNDFLSQVPRPNPVSNPKQSTLQVSGGSTSAANNSNLNGSGHKYQTYRKPLPDAPDMTRLSLKTPGVNPPPQLPPKSGSTLSLLNHQPTSTTSTSPAIPPRQTPPLPQQKSSTNLTQSQQASTAAEPKDAIEVTLVPNESNVQEQSTHPSLDHLAAFTALRDLKAKEILTTERTYCDNMKILVEVFIEPLKAGEGGISKDNATIVCSNLSDILLVSVELLSRLEAKLAAWSNTQRIGDVFLTLIPFLKMYTHYTVGYDNVMTIVSECEKNSTFVQFNQRCTEDPRTRKLDLRSYLIQPVQRITRYHMLLDEVLKHTEPEHPDHADLAKSLAEMKKVTSEANEAIKRSENRAKVLEIQKMFVGDADIVAAHRSFVYEGVLTKVCRKTCKKRHMFLFSDMLIYGSSIPPKLLLHEKIMLEHCRIEDIPDGDSGGSRALAMNNGAIIVNAFQICSAKKSFVVFADTADSKMQWMLRLTQTIESLQSKRSTLKSEGGSGARSEAPVWVPDETTTECRFCSEAFTLLNRRHHCRNCGELVCGKCSDKKFKLPVTDFKPARVCIICYNKLSNNPNPPTAAPKS